MRPIQFNKEPPIGPNSPGAVQLNGKAGDCYIFFPPFGMGQLQIILEMAAKPFCIIIAKCLCGVMILKRSPTRPNEQLPDKDVIR